MKCLFNFASQLTSNDNNKMRAFPLILGKAIISLHFDIKITILMLGSGIGHQSLISLHMTLHSFISIRLPARKIKKSHVKPESNSIGVSLVLDKNSIVGK